MKSVKFNERLFRAKLRELEDVIRQDEMKGAYTEDPKWDEWVTWLASERRRLMRELVQSNAVSR